jgi:hypothetical protein
MSDALTATLDLAPQGTSRVYRHSDAVNNDGTSGHATGTLKIITDPTIVNTFPQYTAVNPDNS